MRKKIEDTEKDTVNKKSFFKRFLTFCVHPTVWRIGILAAAVVTTILTAGAIIPLITLAATAFTAMISIVGKTMQHRSLERTKLQNSLTQVIEKREKEIQQLKKEHSRVFDILSKEGRPFAAAVNLHEIKNIKPENRGRSIARVLGFIGLEQFWTVALFATAANPIGIAVYAGGIALGTAIAKSEYDYRVKVEQERSILKQEINERCKMLGISAYKNERELYSQFKDRMINYKAVELLCKEDVSKLTEAQILEKFDQIRESVSAQMKFTNIPREISFGRNLVNVLNPFKEENAVRTFDINFDADKLHFEMSEGYEKVRPRADVLQNAMSVVQSEELEKATRNLRSAAVAPTTIDHGATAEDVSRKFRDAVKHHNEAGTRKEHPAPVSPRSGRVK